MDDCGMQTPPPSTPSPTWGGYNGGNNGGYNNGGYNNGLPTPPPTNPPPPPTDKPTDLYYPPVQGGGGSCPTVQACSSRSTKLVSVTFKYVGTNSEDHQQGYYAKTFVKQMLPENQPLVRVVITNQRSNPLITSQGFDFKVRLGDTFTIYGTPLGNTIVFSVGGAKIKLHTGCRSPFGWGDKFGVLQVAGFSTTTGTTCHRDITTTSYNAVETNGYNAFASTQLESEDPVDDDESESSSSNGDVIAIAVSVAVVVVLCIILAVLMIRKKKTQAN